MRIASIALSLALLAVASVALAVPGDFTDQPTAAIMEPDAGMFACDALASPDVGMEITCLNVALDPVALVADAELMFSDELGAVLLWSSPGRLGDLMASAYTEPVLLIPK